LSKSFVEYFVSKIDKLRETALGTLRRIPADLLSTLSDLPHTGHTIDSLPLVNSSEVLKLLCRSPPKSSCMDIIPTSLLLQCYDSFSEIIAHLANLSFTTGKFPSRFKTASVTPLLKNPHLDESLPSSYRPISNLNFISKILERLFLQRIQPHILASPNYNQHQSAYRPGHSTETALVHLLDNIYHAADHGKATLLFSLDLSAAFDTIDHSLLLRRLSHSFGFTGSALMWVKSYLTGRSQTVRLGSHCSSCTPCSVGVPQGSVLGPLLFTIYTSPISHIAESHNIQQHQYADDTQLFVALTSNNAHAQVSTLESCLSSLQAWFCSNSMIMNPDKSNSILFATTQRAHFLPDQISVNISGVSIPLCNHVKILGAVLDSRITLSQHTKAVSKSCFYHIRALKQIRGSLDDATLCTVATALVSSRLDYANSILYGIPAKHISRLQRTQNTLARVVTGTGSTDSSSSTLKRLHWLPIDARIKFKIATLTFKALNTGNPPYLASLLYRHNPCRALRSASANVLSVARSNLSFGSRAFRIAAPTVWNSLPPHVRSCTTLTTFRKHLKSHLFQSSFPTA